MKFSYTALTKDNKKIIGVFDVESQEAAQAELHKMGVAILSVNEISDEEFAKLQETQEAAKVEKGIKTFTFLAVDPNGKEVEGTIDAADDISAYRRLRTEYQFKLNNLYESTATPEQQEAGKGLIEGLEAQLEQENASKEAEGGEDKDEDSLDGESEMDEVLIKEIDLVIINTKKVIEEHRELFSNELFQEIEKTLGNLERIRTSNNIKHITEVSNELYELVSNPDKAEEGELSEDFHNLKDEIGESALVKKEFELYKKAIESTGVKKIFSNIATRLKEMTEPKEEEGEEGEGPKGFVAKIKAKVHSISEKFTKKKVPNLADIKKKETKPKGKIGLFIEKMQGYFSATSPILKKTRQKEMMKALKDIFKKDHEEGQEGTEEAEETEEGGAKKGSKKIKKGKDFTSVLVEIDSFVGWLLCFYVIYFFLVSFSLEKGIGLDKDFVFKTMKTPLILNISIFLLLMHLILRMKNLHLRKNAIAGIFLMFFGLGLYALLIVNF